MGILDGFFSNFGQAQSPGILGGMANGPYANGGGPGNSFNSGGGFAHGADQYFQNNQNSLMGLAAGLLQPTLPGQRGAALAQGLQGFQQGRQADQAFTERKALGAAAKSDTSLTPQMQQLLQSSPELARAYLSQNLLNPNQNKMSDLELQQKQFEVAHQGQRIPTWGVVGKDNAQNDVYGWIDPINQKVTQGPPVAGAAPSNPFAMAGKPTDVQAQAAGFADRAAAAHADLEKIGNPNEGFTGWMGNGLTKGPFGYNLLPGMMTSDQRQQFERAKKDFITAELRKESGAVMGATEFDTEDQKYFPQPNDSETVIKQKATARDRAVKNLMREAGPTYKPFSTGGPTAPAAPGAPAAGAALSDPVGIR